MDAIFIATPAPFGPTVRRITTRTSIPLSDLTTTHSAPTVDDLAREHHVPLIGLRRPLGEALSQLLKEIKPELMVVSCFPWRIPGHITSLARFGAINVHPSPLPEFRGPDPLFWAFHEGRQEWAVSVHRMTPALDAGPLLGQARLPVHDRVPGDVFETKVAQVGGDLLANVVDAILSGAAVEQEQDEEKATYQSYPAWSDLLIDPGWSARRTLNFITGVIPLGYSPLIKTGRGVFEVGGASISSRTNEPGETLEDEHTITVRFADEALQISLGDEVNTP